METPSPQIDQSPQSQNPISEQDGEGLAIAIKPVRQKGKLIKALKVVGILVFTTVISYIIALKALEKRVIIPDKKTEMLLETTQSTAANTPIEPDYKNYLSEKYGFGLVYPKEAKLSDFNIFAKEVPSMKLTYLASETEQAFVNDDNFSNGYIVKILVHERLANITVLSFAGRKSLEYRQTCKTNPQITKIAEKTIDSYPATVFGVTGCPLDYKETFIEKDNYVFEVVEIYSGDLGYKQAYISTAGEIVASLNFTDNDNIIEETTAVFGDTKIGFTLRYPKVLNDSCCAINGPLVGTGQKLLILADVPKDADPTTIRNFDGVAFYLDQNTIGKTFDSYVNDQKVAFINDYKLIKGVSPQVSEEKIVIDSVEGVRLLNYAWWAEFIFIPVPNSSKVLIIVKAEKSAKSFDQTFFEVVNSVRFGSATN